MIFEFSAIRRMPRRVRRLGKTADSAGGKETRKINPVPIDVQSFFSQVNYNECRWKYVAGRVRYWIPKIPGAAKEGVLIDVARAVFEKRGIAVSYKLLPWRRALEETRDGNSNALV